MQNNFHRRITLQKWAAKQVKVAMVAKVRFILSSFTFCFQSTGEKHSEKDLEQRGREGALHLWETPAKEGQSCSDLLSKKENPDWKAAPRGWERDTEQLRTH